MNPNQLTAGIGSALDEKYRRGLFYKMRSFSVPVAKAYKNIAAKPVVGNKQVLFGQYQNYAKANNRLREVSEQLMIQDLNLCWSEEETTDFCFDKSRECQRVITLSESTEDAYNKIKNYLIGYNIEIKNIENVMFPESELNRFKCERWWMRKIKTLQVQAIEQTARDLQLVHAMEGKYCSDYTVNKHKQQAARNKNLLEKIEATNEAGKTFTLQQLSDKGISNASNRRAELMTRAGGFEKVAQHRGHIGMFYTFTCPSKYHKMSKGKSNAKYNGSTPKQAHEYLCKQWEKMRAELNENQIKVYGFRVVEPHHDGCPHWHLLLFMERAHVKPVDKIFRRYCFQIDGKEYGASKHRYDAKEVCDGTKPKNCKPCASRKTIKKTKCPECIKLNKNKRTATGYIAKYIAKNIDGYNITPDLFSSPQKSALRVVAWASTFRIRQFQQIGGPSVTVWRQLRKIHANSQCGRIRKLSKAAQANQWAAYVLMMGGPVVERKAQALRPFYEDNEKPSYYGEPVKIITGVYSGMIEETGELINYVKTKIHDWTLGPVKKGLSVVVNEYLAQAPPDELLLAA